MTVPAIQTLSEVVEGKITDDNKPTKSPILAWCRASWRKIFSEFLSTAMLILLGCMTTIPIEGVDSPIYSPLGFGMVVMFNIQIFGHISGAFMNPTVTVASIMFGNTSIVLGIVYIIVQIAGALAGYGILDALTSMDLAENAVCVTSPLPGQNAVQSMGIEMALTAALMFINCAIWDPVNKDKLESAPIKFGLTILGLSVVGGPLTGASMNPARTLGPAVYTNVWTDHWIYWVGPMLGSVIATAIYMFIFLQKRRSD